LNKVGVIDSEDSGFFKVARKKLSDCPVELVKWNASEEYDAVIISGHAAPTDSVIRGGAVITPGGSRFKIESKFAISYGMSSRDTITASSNSEDGIVIALSRDIVDFEGKTVQRQEFTSNWKMSAFNALPIAAVKILSGKTDLNS
jgi:hypothetical protein